MEFIFPLHSWLFPSLRVNYDKDNKDKRSNKFGHSSHGIHLNFKGNLSLKSNYLHDVLDLREHSERDTNLRRCCVWRFRVKVALLPLSCRPLEASTGCALLPPSGRLE